MDFIDCAVFHKTHRDLALVAFCSSKVTLEKLPLEIMGRDSVRTLVSGLV